MNKPTPDRHGPKSRYTGGEGLAGGTDQRKTGHGCTKHAHQQHKGTNRPTGHKVILTGPLEESTAKDTQAQHPQQISTHDPKWDGRINCRE